MDNVTLNILQRSHGKDQNTAHSVTEGKLVFDKDRSRYLHSGFWAAMYDEVFDPFQACESSLSLDVIDNSRSQT